MSPAVQAEINALEARLTALGWPNRSENEDLCMQRAREFFDGRDVILARHGLSYEEYLKSLL